MVFPQGQRNSQLLKIVGEIAKGLAPLSPASNRLGDADEHLIGQFPRRIRQERRRVLYAAADVLFINAAEHFEKGKRQNRLLPEHIDKIVDTYRARSEQSRYARRVDMAEIEQNDFNLNISRYVSTAQAEEEVDLFAVHEDLEKIEQELTKAKQRHNAFLKELGLPLLP